MIGTKATPVMIKLFVTGAVPKISCVNPGGRDVGVNDRGCWASGFGTTPSNASAKKTTVNTRPLSLVTYLPYMFSSLSFARQALTHAEHKYKGMPSDHRSRLIWCWASFPTCFAREDRGPDLRGCCTSERGNCSSERPHETYAQILFKVKEETRYGMR